MYTSCRIRPWDIKAPGCGFFRAPHIHPAIDSAQVLIAEQIGFELGNLDGFGDSVVLFTWAPLA